jgi:hypothetical protein
VIVKTVKKKDREPIEYETVTLKVPRILMEFLYNTPTHYGLNPIPFLEYELVDAIRSDLEATTGEEIIKWNELGSVFYAILEDERYREIGERNGDSTGKP